MSVVRLQFEYRLILPYTLPLRLRPLPSLSPKSGTRRREGRSTRAESKPLPFQYMGSVFRSDSDTFPLHLDPFVLLIHTSSLRCILDLRRIPIGNRYLTRANCARIPVPFPRRHSITHSPCKVQNSEKEWMRNSSRHGI
jgi:hypothetical protein